MLQSVASVWGKMPFDHNIIRYMHTNEVPVPVFQWQALIFKIEMGDNII